MAEPGYLPSPDYYDEDLYETVGYVERIWIEQESGRDAMFFLLAIYVRDVAGWLGRGDAEPRYQKFFVYLDIATTVALGQLQLLRDAMWSRMSTTGSPLLVRVHFNFRDESEVYAHPYWVGISLTQSYPVHVNDFYADEIGRWGGRWIGNWYVHLDPPE